MKKALIIYGDAPEYKHMYCRKLWKDSGAGILVDAISFSENRQKTYNKCTQITDLVLVLGCPERFDYSKFFNAITDGVYIKKRGREPILINPKFVFMSVSHMYELSWHSGSMKERFEFEHFSLPF